MTGRANSSTTAPRALSTSAAARTAARISGSSPSPKQSTGRPMRFPRTSPVREDSRRPAGASRLVPSRGSFPWIRSSTAAQSAAERAMGPIWSREEA